MDLVRLSDSAYQLRGGSNAGLIVQDGRAVLVDTGLDKDTAKKILRALNSLSVPLAAIVVTHAHADHFGGAATLRARTGAPVYAPAFEAAIIANPLLEPLYLYSGAAPVSDLRHKFTLADACPVDFHVEPGDVAPAGIALRILPAPGHAPQQVMVAGGGVCFVADACFAPEVLRKHGIPFYVDVDETTATLNALASLGSSYAFYVPGHGPAVSDISSWAALNIEHLAEIRHNVAAALAETDDTGRIVQTVARRMELQIASPVTYWLTHTTILACLSALEKAGMAAFSVADNRLICKPDSRR